MANLKAAFFLVIISVSLYAQDIKINKIEPPNWWAGMNLNNIQLMVCGENLNDVTAVFDCSDIVVKEVHKTDNPSYAFIDIEISDKVKPGDYTLTLSNSNSELEFSYPVLERDVNKHSGFDQSDIIYLLMPDRFANGDTSNDVVSGYGNDLDRSKGIARHGGDIQGIINNLDYIKETGFTAIWINPLVENNTQVSYHGYGATDFYKIDPRFGTNELYKKLVSKAHEKGLKIILDHVANHIHINHPWMKNLPVMDWINGSRDKFELTRHDKISLMDVHGDKSTLKNNTTGWFTDYMPDLNQQNPYMANYIIQNTIWWMEYAGIDGIREDTYPYADPEFMAEWAKVILKEYPNTNIVGEVWKGEPVFLAGYQEQSKFTPGFNSYLPLVTDFGLSDALRGYLHGSRTLSNIYEIIGMDYVYHNPDNLVTFIDNHDVERAMFAAKENIAKVKIALQIVLTTRGIPQILYATELGAVGEADHGALRTDFPGGFPGDTLNAFTKEGRTPKENEMYDFLKQIIKIRSENKALQTGKLVHFQPHENMYVYFRISDNEKIMVVVNDNNNEKEVDFSQLGSMLDNIEALIDLKSDNLLQVKDLRLVIKPFDTGIYKLN